MFLCCWPPTECMDEDVGGPPPVPFCGWSMSPIRVLSILLAKLNMSLLLYYGSRGGGVLPAMITRDWCRGRDARVSTADHGQGAVADALRFRTIRNNTREKTMKTDIIDETK